MMLMVAGVAGIIKKASAPIYDPRKAVDPTVYIHVGNKCLLQAFAATNGAMTMEPGIKSPVEFEERNLDMMQARQLEQTLKKCGATIEQVK